MEYGVAQFVLPGQTESGDRHLVHCGSSSVRIAVIDGLGHGAEAATAAKLAISALETPMDELPISLMQLCHEKLRTTRGVVLSMASVDPLHGMMTWIGVGNVQGALLRANANKSAIQEMLLLRAGVVGAQLPALQAAILPVGKGDTIVFATDGIRSEFAENLSALEQPQRLADRILERYCRGNDDALVLVARLTKVLS